MNSKIYEQSLLTLYFLNLFTQETSILSVSFSRSSFKILSAKSLRKEVNRIMLRNEENIISIFLSPILSLMVIWGNGIIEPFPK